MENKEFFKDIKVVGFDFDNTLVDEEYSIKKRWQHVLKGYSYLSPYLEKTFFKIYKNRRPDYGFHLNDTLRELKLDNKLVKEIVANFLTVHNGELLLEGSREIINFLLSKKIKVGIITSGKQPFQEKRIKEAGIYKFMSFVYYGDGKQKPWKEIFNQHLKDIVIKSAKQFLYVGDDFVNDIQPVISFGARACWISKEKSLLKNAEMITVSSLKELLKYFKKNLK